MPSGSRRAAAAIAALCLGLAWGCDDSIEPEPPKESNLPPETFLAFQGDSLNAQFYKVELSWLGSDADGHVARYQRRFVCVGTGDCPLDLSLSTWTDTTATTQVFALPVPASVASYRFEVRAVDDEGLADPTPAMQEYEFFNSAPVAGFEGRLPTTTLPAVTFYLTAADPDTTPEADDGDFEMHLDRWRVWLDGSESSAKSVPYDSGSVTLRLEDFDDRLDRQRTVFVQAVDDGEATSPTISHTWTVESAPDSGILLVDDCRTGVNLEITSDRSYRNVLGRRAPQRLRVLDIEQYVPLPTQGDLDATLALFQRVVWYTDADVASSGALELARESLLDLLRDRAGRMLLVSGVAFGTNGAFGEAEPEFRGLFGIDSLFTAPNGTTNFPYSRADTIQASVHPGLSRFWMLSLGNPGAGIMDCFRTAREATSVYFYPDSTLVRGTFRNPVQFDIGVVNQTSAGGWTAFATWPMGLPIISNTGINEVEIEEILERVGILDP